MKPAPFEYHRVHALDDAIARLGELGDDAKVLAGGQSLVPMMNFRIARPTALVDINRVPGLDHIARDGDALSVGALVRHAAIEHLDGEQASGSRRTIPPKPPGTPLISSACPAATAVRSIPAQNTR
jgi:aerobic carbon-monoxide dehydrogenase medium subunit